MIHVRRTIALMTVALLLAVVCASAADLSGTWKASFDTAIGQQNYTYVFAVNGAALTGTIESEMGGKSEIVDGKIDGEKVSFVEIFKLDGMEIRITYTGQAKSADEITFTRQVADFATEALVAKRVK
ncbi:MAG: hypothetical protein ABIX28_25865 [Vicinamibacterales bacterium]